jgi:hypothetical protein
MAESFGSLEPDAHNNIAVRKMFANAYGGGPFPMSYQRATEKGIRVQQIKT